MNSYGHYAVDNGVPPYAGEDMIAGTVVELDNGVIVKDKGGDPIGVLAYDVAKDDTCTVATDGVVNVRVVGAAAIGEWLLSNEDGTVSTDGTGVHIGTARVACSARGAGIYTQTAVHLNILPVFPAAPTEGGTD